MYHSRFVLSYLKFDHYPCEHRIEIESAKIKTNKVIIGVDRHVPTTKRTTL